MLINAGINYKISHDVNNGILHDYFQSLMP